MTTLRAPTASRAEPAQPAGVNVRGATAFAWAASGRATLVLILIVTALRVFYVAWGCPYALIEDEAHYWEWSRRPGWSYYSKGPGIAWAVAASTSALGDTEFAVRLPAVAFGAIGAWAIAGLARLITGDARAGFAAAACALLTPAFQLGGVLLTVDMPYSACWALACSAAWRAATARSRAAWVGLGASLGAGFLFKYTTLALVPGLILFVILARGRVRLAENWSRWFAAGTLTLAACMVPVVVWNARHGWPTVQHLLGHAALPGGDMPPGGARRLESLAWVGEFLAAQLAIIGPVLVLIGLSIARAYSLRGAQPAEWLGRLFLLCAAAPILAGYTLLSLWNEVEGNWAVAGYVSLFALSGWGVVDGLSRVPPSRTVRHAWRVSLLLGVTLAVAALKLDWVNAAPTTLWLERGLARVGWLPDDRRLVPMGRLTGARDAAADAAELGEALRARTGQEPFYIAEHYGRASLLAFYLPGQPIVYCSSWASGKGRRTQYDYWPDTDLADLARLGGRPAVLIGSTRERWELAFEHVEPVGRLKHETKKDRSAFLGFGYRGFNGPADPSAGEGAR